MCNNIKFSSHLSPFFPSPSYIQCGAGYAKGGVTCSIFALGAEGGDMRRPGGWKSQIWENGNEFLTITPFPQCSAHGDRERER